MEARTPEDVPAASKAPARKAGQRLHRAGPARSEPGCPSRAGRCLGVPSPRTSSSPGRRRPRAKAARQPGTQRLGEPGPHSTSGVGGARPPRRMPRTGSPSLRPSGHPARDSAKGRGARSAKAAGPRDSGAEARAGRGPGREVFTVGSARRRSSSARLGLLHYCFRPQRRRRRQRRQPRARPRPLPPVPSREGWWGDARGGAVEGKAARRHGGCGLPLSPPAPTPRPWLGCPRDPRLLADLLRFSGTWRLICPPPRGK